MPRAGRFSPARMTPTERRREAVAILAGGLCRMHPILTTEVAAFSRSGPDPACNPGADAAQCVLNGTPHPDEPVDGAGADEDAR